MPGASILVPWQTILAAWGHLEEPREQQKDILGSRVGFYGFFIDFGTHWESLCGTLEQHSCFYLCLFLSFFFRVRIFWSDDGCVELEKEAFGGGESAKTTFRRYPDSVDSWLFFAVFVHGIGFNLPDFWCSGNRFEIH